MMAKQTAKQLRVEFRYFDRSACSRCRITDKNVARTLLELRGALGEARVEVKLKTTKLPASRLGESNSVLINEIDVEALVKGEMGSRFTPCRGCGTLSKSPCECRAYTYRGKKYRYIPRAMIREAIQKVLVMGGSHASSSR